MSVWESARPLQYTLVIHVELSLAAKAQSPRSVTMGITRDGSKEASRNRLASSNLCVALLFDGQLSGHRAGHAAAVRQHGDRVRS